jgi:hypothetical protein
VSSKRFPPACLRDGNELDTCSYHLAYRLVGAYLPSLATPLDAEIDFGSEIDIHSVFLNDCSWERSVIPPDNLINSRTTFCPLHDGQHPPMPLRSTLPAQLPVSTMTSLALSRL